VRSENAFRSALFANRAEGSLASPVEQKVGFGISAFFSTFEAVLKKR
jgi:hypothetical protein